MKLLAAVALLAVSCFAEGPAIVMHNGPVSITVKKCCGKTDPRLGIGSSRAIMVSVTTTTPETVAYRIELKYRTNEDIDKAVSSVVDRFIAEGFPLAIEWFYVGDVKPLSVDVKELSSKTPISFDLSSVF